MEASAATPGPPCAVAPAMIARSMAHLVFVAMSRAGRSIVSSLPLVSLT
jgi:hypothetical protein